MSATSISVIESGRDRLRAGPWRGDRDTAYLNPLPGAPLPSTDFVRRCLRTLAREGYRRVVTGALSPSEQAAFRAAGFLPAEHLHLLSHDLRSLPEANDGLPLRRGLRRDREAVLAVDALAFDTFWRLDAAGLHEALEATPHTRLRVVLDAPGGLVVGYAVTGRAGRRGYLQRLAVHPDHQGAGLGLVLVVDALRWLRRWRTERAMVNTQHANDRALALYERAGFRREPSGLSVLARELDG